MSVRGTRMASVGARHVARVRAERVFPVGRAVVVVRLELGAALVERERVPEHADGGIRRSEGKPLGDEPD